jgi:hypothetical protein
MRLPQLRHFAHSPDMPRYMTSRHHKRTFITKLCLVLGFHINKDGSRSKQPSPHTCVVTPISRLGKLRGWLGWAVVDDSDNP